MEIKLGHTYRDKVTGFEGIATAETRFLYACNRVCLTGEGQDPKDVWVDSLGVEEVEHGRVVEGFDEIVPVMREATRTGGPGPTPPARTTGAR